MTETHAWVEYAVPVLVLVNAETREVERVITCDEETRLTGRVFADGGSGDITQVGDSELPAGLLRKAVLDIAESAAWPPWEAGF